MGYCIGGTCALEIARDDAAVRGVVSFHGGLATKHPATAGRVQAKVLVCNGADDPFVPPAQVTAFNNEMTRA
jgi:dienelactone hydrolase